MWGEGDEDATDDGNMSSMLSKPEPPSLQASLASSEATKTEDNNMLMWGMNERPSSRPSSEKTPTKKVAEDDDGRHLCTCVFVCDCKERILRQKRTQRLEKEREERNTRALEQLLSSHTHGIQQPLHEFLQEHGIQPPSLGKYDMRQTTPRPRPKQKNSGKGRGKGRGKNLQKKISSSIEVVDVVEEEKEEKEEEEEEEEKEEEEEEDSGTTLVARDVATAAEAMADRMFKTMDELKKRDLVVKELQQLLQEYSDNNNDDNDDILLKLVPSLRTKQNIMKRTNKKRVPPEKGTTFGGFVSRGGGSSASPPSSSSFSFTPSPPSRQPTMSRSKSGNLKHNFLKRSSKSVYMTTTTKGRRSGQGGGQMASTRKEKSPTTQSDRAALRLAHASIW